jgi:hypothetical protein
VQAIAFAGPPMAALIVIYSFVLWPLRRKPVADRKSPIAELSSIESRDTL